MISRVVRAVFLVLGALLVAPGSLSAQQANSITISGVRISSTGAEFAITILDDSGNPVGGLAPGDFVVAIDGAATTPVTVNQAVDSDLALGLAVVVDTSGSMAGAPIATAREVIAPLFAALAPNDRAALIAFADQVTTVAAPTGDTAALTAALDGLTAVGNTALYSAVADTLAALTPLPEPRRVAVLLSDGQDFGGVSTVSREAALAAATEAALPFFIVALGTEVDLPFLDALATGTGGVRFTATTAADLARIYDEISARLRLQYALAAPLPSSLAPGVHTLSVSVAGSSAEVPFTIAGSETVEPAIPAFTAIQAPLREPTVVRLTGFPDGTLVRFLLGETALTAEPDGLSVRLDPYTIAPGEYVLRALPESRAPIEQAVSIAPLQPQLRGPADGTELAPGDVVRPDVVAQPGTTALVYVLDGRELGRQTAPPFSFTVPTDLAEGSHTLEIIVASDAGDVRREYAIPVAAAAGGAPIAALVTSAVAVALLAGLLVLLWLRRSRRQSGPTVRVPETDGAGSRVASGPWGRLVVLEGPASGKTFVLVQDVELVGRGAACTVRVDDPAMAPEHFVMERSGLICPSTPESPIAVDGSPTVRAIMVAGQAVRAGASVFRLDPVEGEPAATGN